VLGVTLDTAPLAWGPPAPPGPSVAGHQRRPPWRRPRATRAALQLDPCATRTAPSHCHIAPLGQL